MPRWSVVRAGRPVVYRIIFFLMTHYKRALQELEDACDLYAKRRFASALVLAGAAMEILELLVIKRGRIGALAERVGFVASKQHPTPKLSDVRAWLNVPYNKAKHARKRGPARWRKFSYRKEAADRLDIAVTNLRRLTADFTESDAVMRYLERPLRHD